MPGRLIHKADFERVLAVPSCRRSAHFALHHLPGRPLAARGGASGPVADELSTAAAPACPQPVDESPQPAWMGCVVPKRHARRAVTRNLLKRQMRGAFERHAGGLGGGLWLLRLRAPFAPAQFVSARSTALAAAARGELDALLDPAAARRPGAPATSRGGRA